MTVLAVIRFMLRSHRAIRAAVVHGLGDDGEARFRTLAEAIPQIVWTALPDSSVDYCNRRWYELTGLREEQTLGLGWSSGLHPDDRPVALQNWERVLRTGEPFEMEYRLKNAAGGFRWHLVRATPMRDSSGAIVKWFGACADIDDQMRNQQVLEEQLKQHTAALMDANTRLQSEMRERALAQQELNQQTERMVEELTKRSNRSANLAKMAELLQTCADLKDAFAVVAGMAPKVFPELRGALLLFNASREMLDVAALWGDCELAGGRVWTAGLLGSAHRALAHCDGGRPHRRVPALGIRRAFLLLPAADGARRSHRDRALPDDRPRRASAACIVGGQHVHRAGGTVGGQHSPARGSAQPVDP